ncbi:ABC transporter ATP-binding protein [Corynebacterium epidermidicanis]|uniref:ABC-type multidrug transport system, ATPase component n=1 Tax=Corynebacterium epidermidicanis TaxID=1050174 RepID=A0A0G3GV49_9CORY|nr:ABC transporter ATP-binding protein [Corynebacterium epidermidicanis]AKK03408.1 ABC-type multidrug transport system, ATPase component [Corynebacterium epidermidicanis]
MTVPALSIKNLSKRFGPRVVVDNVSLDVEPGSIYGIVGPNGAGKTTMLSMATGLIQPDNGTSEVCGHDVWHDDSAAKNAMGLLVDGYAAFNRLSGLELLQFSGALRSMPAAEIDQRARELLEALGLTSAGNKRIVDYSAGMTKKIYLANALLHSPRLVVLDEPLEAVDPASGQVIQQILRRYAAGGGTVVLSSHVMGLVEGLCTHVAIMNEGRIHIAGHVDDVRAGRSLTEIFVEIAGGGQLAEGSLGWLQGEPGNA